MIFLFIQEILQEHFAFIKRATIILSMERLSKIYSTVSHGLEAMLVEVEVDVGAGIPSLTIVGLPDKAVEESKERVRLALKNSGFDFPQKKIVVNLAPANIKKEGPAYDLPIAIGILVAAGLIEEKKISKTIFMGELSLGGEIKMTRAIVQAASLAKAKNFRLVIPAANLEEASLVSGVAIYAPENLKDIYTAITESKSVFQISKKHELEYQQDFADFDFKNIVGQAQAKRALEIAAAGGHNILLSGSPGGGKTLLSKSIVSILPQLTEQEMLEITKIYSVAGILSDKLPYIQIRPFRSPHHTTSAVAIIGGGTYPKPGEVSLAHKGVLFLDEFPEFPRMVLEALRQPLEDRVVTISRAQGSIEYPADFILIAAQNPCPCGYLGDAKHECTCSSTQIISYKKRVSGPLLDRIDLNLQVEKIPLKNLKSKIIEEKSDVVRSRVEKARLIQVDRSQKSLGRAKLNSSLSKNEIEQISPMSRECEIMLEQAVEKLDLSMRSYLKLKRIARTIADLEGSSDVHVSHIVESLQYRAKGNA